MKITKAMETALNKQINAEYYSSYLYLAMSVYFEQNNLNGFANWMRIQAHEEWGHGTKILTYLLDIGAGVNLAEIAKPENSWKSPLEVFKASLSHERKVTGMINDLYNLARSDKDNATEIFLQWFVTEQVEEESSAEDIVSKLEMADGVPGALFMIDKELGQRVRVQE
ncbi:MAG: ferritin [Candidatus Micrarchaeota archaeon]|nr:ferritin [Candidatus Micrarchaeota archaeon]